MKILKIQLNILTAFIFVLLVASSPALAQNAAATYKGKCVGCHGVDGKGNTAPGKALGVHDFSSEEVTKMSDANLAKDIASGKNKMPAYSKTLNDAQIKDLVAYVRKLAK